MRRYIEDLDRNRDDDDTPEPAFQCPCCNEVLDYDEGVVLEQRPDVVVCLNCLCG
ncbi:hypothetical protein [Methylobacterium sp. WL12]|uniref:hypothetical protein n=1 Tax=Methylobacterium sp. WL12 TaxID=2603890 RepID=UPI00164EFC5D|nr:hypothetical protein [Methylobacterium sp. WL12]